MLSKTLVGEEYPFPTEAIIDILDEYNVNTFSSHGNVKGRIKNIAALQLVSRPYMALRKIREGMGTFWDNMSKAMVDVLYLQCEPTQAAAVKRLRHSPVSVQLNRVFK